MELDSPKSIYTLGDTIIFFSVDEIESIRIDRRHNITSRKAILRDIEVVF